MMVWLDFFKKREEEKARKGESGLHDKVTLWHYILWRIRWFLKKKKQTNNYDKSLSIAQTILVKGK